MKRFQKTSQIFTIALCLLCSPAAGLSDDTTPSETAAPLSITDNRISVPLESVLLLALKNNLDITFARLQPELSQTDIMREKGAYDTFFSSQFTKYRENKQVGSALMGSGAGSDLFQEQFNLDASLAKKFTSGTQAELKLSHKESENGMPFSGLVPEYYGELSMSLTQPLLRDFGIKIGSSMIRIASLNLEVSENELRRNVMDILYQVEAFYWDLLFRIEDLKSKQKSLKRAEDLEREFKIRIDAGTLAPIEIYQAKAEVALRTQEVIVAESQVASAEDNLKAALNLYEDEKYWNIIIVPTDMPDTTKINPNLTECIAIALEKRPDFKQAQLNIKASNIQVKYAKNQTMPRIDLIGTIGTNGLAGRPQDTRSAFLGDLGRFTKKQVSPFDGHWDDVYDGMARGDYYQYTVGIKIEFPFENRLAKSQHSRARIQKRQAVTSLKNTENRIINEVRDAIRLLETSSKVIDTASASLKLSQEKLKAEEKKYKVGMSTAHDVLEFQEELSKAESTLARAQTEYSKAKANLGRVMGVMLEQKGLQL